MNARFLTAVGLLWATSVSAAPIYADVTIEGGIHLWSEDQFLVTGYWTPAITQGSVLDNPFHVGNLSFDGEVYRLDAAFPTSLVGCGGTFQIDAWWHGGWFGETQQTGQSCGSVPQLPPPFEPPIDPQPPVDPISPNPPIQVPEPASITLLGLGGLGWRLRTRHRTRASSQSSSS